MTTTDARGVALYHVVLAHEGFAEAARALFQLIRRAQEMRPGGRRLLFLDIEGHRQADGRFGRGPSGSPRAILDCRTRDAREGEGGAKAHYDGSVALSQTDFTDDLKRITVPVRTPRQDAN